jgi:hypothetical protein
MSSPQDEKKPLFDISKSGLTLFRYEFGWVAVVVVLIIILVAVAYLTGLLDSVFASDGKAPTAAPSVGVAAPSAPAPAVANQLNNLFPSGEVARLLNHSKGY